MATYSPEIEAWLMGLGPNPFQPESYDYWQPVMPPENPEDRYTLDYQNQVLTMLGKANNEYSDLAQIAQLGAGPGGASPDQFEPFATFTPVEAPGYMRMQQYLNSGDPVLRFAAQKMSGFNNEQPWTALQVETALRQIAENDPEGDIARNLPLYRDDTTNSNRVDWKRMGDTLSGLEMDVLKDPQFNAFDPQTGLPAQVTYEDTEIAKYFKERNLPNPYETYSPDLLASRDILSREGYNADQMVKSQEEMANADKYLSERRAALQSARDEASSRPTTYNAYQKPPAAPGYMKNMNRGGEGGGSSGPSIQPIDYHPGAPGGVSDQAFDRSRQDALSRQAAQAYVKAILARKENEEQGVRRTKDRQAQIDRQRMMAALTAQGYTPFNDVNRARQSSVFGG